MDWIFHKLHYQKPSNVNIAEVSKDCQNMLSNLQSWPMEFMEQLTKDQLALEIKKASSKYIST